MAFAEVVTEQGQLLTFNTFVLKGREFLEVCITPQEAFNQETLARSFSYDWLFEIRDGLVCLPGGKTMESFAVEEYLEEGDSR